MERVMEARAEVRGRGSGAREAAPWRAAARCSGGVTVAAARQFAAEKRQQAKGRQALERQRGGGEAA